MVTERNDKYSTLRRCWEGLTCYILGGGPSLSLVDVDRLLGRPVIAINMAYKIAPWARILYFADPRLHARYGQEMAQCAGLRFTTSKRMLGTEDVYVLRQQNTAMGLSARAGIVNWNLSAGACAVDIAAHLGVKRIVLFGYDLRRVDGRTNWHDYYGYQAEDPYGRFRKRFMWIARSLREMGIGCVNATPGSALRYFPIVDPREVLA